MSMTSPLDDVVAKGKEHYQAGRSFSQWSLIMVHQHGQAITPYLEDAWKLIGENTKIAQKRKQDMIIEAPFDTNEAPKSRILYRMVAPGRFAPVAKEDPPAKTAERLRLRQTIVAVAAIAFIVGGLFPPWLYTLDLADGPHARRDAGFAFILSSPKMEAAPDEFRSFRKFAGIQLDARRLLVEWACILAIGGAALFLCGRTVAKQDHKSA